MSESSPHKKIGLFVLILFIVGSIDSLRNMPSAAMFGTQLIFFFLVAALTFLLPVALISAELSSYHGHKNGIYQWVKEAFGKQWAFITIWFQWINTTIWFPSILLFIAGGLAYVFHPAWVHNKIYVVCVILISFWSMTLLSLKNLSLSATFAAFCALFGFVLPFIVMLIFLAVWLISGHPIQLHFTSHNLLPNFDHLNNWVSLTAIFTAFLGMELAAIHIKDIRNPHKLYPIGVTAAAMIIVMTMMVGSLAIAIVIPSNQIGLISGIFQALHYYLAAFHLNWLVWIISFLIVLSTLGELVNWITSPARGLQQAAQTGSLPKLLTKNNAHGMPAPVLILQAIIVSLVCIGFAIIPNSPSVNSIYWLLTDLSTELYLAMYVLMFLAALKLHYKHHKINKPFTLPGGKFGKWMTCVVALLACLCTMIIGFIPPKQIDYGAAWHYPLIFACGIIVLTIPAVILLRIYRDQHA